jgi:D-alanine transaminase
MNVAMIDDRIVDANQLDSSYLDRGLYFGDGVYEVLRSYNGKIFALDDHLARFTDSLAGVEIDGVDMNQIRSRVLKAFDTAKIPNAKIYFHVTRGSGPRDHNPAVNMNPNFFLTISEIGDYSKSKINGYTVSTYPDLRWKKCWIKSLNLLPNVLAKMDAAKKGCDEAILVDENGLITEGSSSAFFACVGRTIQTAPTSANILPSITRKYTMKAAHNLGLAFIEKSLTPEQAKNADELFLGVTTKDIIPVVKFDNLAIGSAAPGPITRKLISEFEKFTK